MAASVELHFNIACKKNCIIPGTQTVLRTAKKSCGECSPEVPGVPWQVKSADLYTESAVKSEPCIPYIAYMLPERNYEKRRFKQNIHVIIAHDWQLT